MSNVTTLHTTLCHLLIRTEWMLVLDGGWVFTRVDVAYSELSMHFTLVVSYYTDLHTFVEVN